MTGYTFPQLIDFTRTSAATFVNSSGNITSTAQSRNLLTFTEEFANAAWTKLNATITANSTAAPNGINTADTLVATAGTAARSVTQAGGSSGVQQTFSVYAKAGTSSFVQIWHGAAANIYANFNLATGVVGTVGAGATATITSVGNGWYRCTITCTPGSTNQFRVAMITSATAVYAESWTAAGTETIFIWGAQLEQASSATDYTRNFGGLFPPRFDYDPVTLAPRGLLIEEQRTNLLLRSEEFDNAAWTKLRSSVTANATTSPDGTVDADKLVEDTTASDTHLVAQGATLSAVSHTFTVYVKAAERSWVHLVNNSIANVSAYFNVGSGTIGTVGSAATASITNAGNGWYRCSIAFTASAGTNNMHIRLATANNTEVYTGDGTSGIFIYGAQLEAGAFATSYIPTVASQVTRSADSALIQAPNFASWYNQSEGSLVVEADSVVGNLAAVNSPSALTDGTANNMVRLYIFSGVRGTSVTTGGVTQADMSAAGHTSNAIGKWGFAYKANDFALSLNGAAALTDTSGTVPTVDRLSIGSVNSGNQLNGHIRSIRYYPTKLSNAQLQALTA